MRCGLDCLPPDCPKTPTPFHERCPTSKGRVVGWAASAIRCRSAGGKHVAEIANCLADCRTHGRSLRDRIQHHEVVDRAVVPERSDADTSLCQLAPVGFAFIAQNVVLIDEQKRFAEGRSIVRERHSAVRHGYRRASRHPADTGPRTRTLPSW